MSDILIDPDRFAAINLQKGSHSSPDDGQCLLEAVSFLVGEQFSDHPKCVSPILGAFGRNLNDVLPDDLRQELKGLIPSLPGTAGDGMDERRGYMALDWLIRTWLPAWLDLSPSLREDAVKVRELGRIVDLVSAERAGPVVRQAQKNAAAAGAAAWDAAGAAAGDAARAAAGDAARAAAGDAAWAAVGAAARAAAWDAARAAAGAAAWNAAGAAAWNAAGDAAWAAVGDAARTAVGDAISLTVRDLQLSAIDLFRDMIKSPTGVGDE
jgi:hypothetical protein